MSDEQIEISKQAEEYLHRGSGWLEWDMGAMLLSKECGWTLRELEKANESGASHTIKIWEKELKRLREGLKDFQAAHKSCTSPESPKKNSDIELNKLREKWKGELAVMAERQVLDVKAMAAEEAMAKVGEKASVGDVDAKQHLEEHSAQAQKYNMEAKAMEDDKRQKVESGMTAQTTGVKGAIKRVFSR